MASLLVPASVAKDVTAAAQELGVAVMVSGEARDAARASADGIQVEADTEAVAAAREQMGKDRFVGAHAGGSRHFAMEAAEAANRELQLVNAQLSNLATTDTLTGAWNRRHFEQELQRELIQSQRYAEPLSLLMFDIDHFKAVNDRYGHPVGDAVLVGLTRLVQQNLRAADTLARWGGEEFVIMMPHCGASEAVGLAEKLRIDSQNPRRWAKADGSGEAQQTPQAIGDFTPIPDHLLPPAMRNGGIARGFAADLVAKHEAGENVDAERLSAARRVLARGKSQERVEVGQWV